MSDDSQQQSSGSATQESDALDIFDLSEVDRIAARLSSEYEVETELAWGGDTLKYYAATRGGDPVVLCAFPDEFASGQAYEALVALVESMLEVDAPPVLRVRGLRVVDAVPVVEYDPERGRTLDTALAHGPLPSFPLLKVADQVLRGVIACHRRSIVHGDLVPEQIVVLRGSDMKSPKVRIVGAGTGELLREFDYLTPARPMSGAFGASYAPPEIGRGIPATARSDLYAVGVLLHHMVVGSPGARPAPHAGFDDIPQMPDVIRRATAIDAAERYSDAAGMLAALDWLDIVSSKMNPHTQDIPLWMEHSVVGNIPVTELNAASDLPSPLPARPSSRPPPSRRTSPPPSAPPPGILRGSHKLPTSAPPVRITLNAPVVPPAGSAPPDVPSIPGPAGVPLVARRTQDDHMLWWVAAALTLIIILIGLAWAFFLSGSATDAAAPLPATIPNAASVTP